MDKEKDEIDKIDEQIESIKEETKEESKKEEKKKDEEAGVKLDASTFDKTSEMATLDDDIIKEPSPKKSNKWLWILIGVLVIIVLTIVLAIFMAPKKTGTDKKRELSKVEQKEALEEYGEALEGLIGVYLESKDVLLRYEDAILLVKYDYEIECDEHEIYEDGKVYLNKCSIEDEQVEYSYGTKQEKEELKEGAIKVYIYKKNNNATLTEPSNLKEYDVYSFDIEGKYTELNLLGAKSDYVFYRDENYNGKMVNFKTREKALKSVDYSSISPIMIDDKYDQEYVSVSINNKNGVYKLDTEEATVPVKYSYFMSLGNGVSGPTAAVNAVNDGVIGVVIMDNQRSKLGAINYRTNKEVIPVEYKRFSKSGKYIWVVDDYDIAHIFDFSGKEILKDRYDEIYTIVDGKYVLAKDKESIVVVTNEGKELYNFGNIKLGRFNYAMSYKNGAAYMFDNPNVDPESPRGNCIELLYDPNTKDGTTKETVCGGVAKPILYLYPEEETNVEVTFEKPKLLETTYPKFKEKWEVTAKPNGDLTDKDGKYYYGLYWDETQVHFTNFEEGFYVTKDDAIDFLEEKLSIIGLNDRERNEFIMYWLPILEKNEKSLVYFELTNERESVNKINITPTPDSLLRIVIHIKKVDKKVNIKEEKLTTFERVGFTAVEWGGSTY